MDDERKVHMVQQTSWDGTFSHTCCHTNCNINCINSFIVSAIGRQKMWSSLWLTRATYFALRTHSDSPKFSWTGLTRTRTHLIFLNRTHSDSDSQKLYWPGLTHSCLDTSLSESTHEWVCLPMVSAQLFHPLMKNDNACIVESCLLTTCTGYSIG